jgi:IS6 family transposase
MRERGFHIDHTTIYRWVQHYAPELEKRCRSHLKATNDSWRVDETYVKVKKVWMYLYRAVDSQGNTLEFLLSPRRDGEAAKRFFAKTPAASRTSTPRVIAVDKNAAYPKAFKELKAERVLPDGCELRQSKYLNNLVDAADTRTMNMRRSGQIGGVGKRESMKQVAFIASLFGVAI